MRDNSKIIEAIEQTDKRSIIDVAEQFNIGERRSDTPDSESALKEAQDWIINILNQTGDDIFDDEAQWHTYQNAIAALVLADREIDQRGSRSLAEHQIEKPAQNDYNPLGELNELAEPTVEQLGDRYNVDEVLSIDEDAHTSMRLQQILGMALLNISPARLPGKHAVERKLLAAMVCVDEHYTTRTILEVSPVTRTTTGYDGEPFEYETKEMGFQQGVNVDQSLFDNV